MEDKEQDVVDFNPATNPNAISIVKQPDGNYKGYMNKFGTVVEVRQGEPHTVLELLITHDGQTN